MSSRRIGQAISNIVEKPWQSECTDTEHPWEATLALRAEWLDILNSAKSQEFKIAACMGLGTCAWQTPKEASAVELFLAEDFDDDHWPQIARRLVTGAAPPFAMWPSYFLPNLGKNNSPLLDFLLGIWLRNPARAESAKEMLFSGDMGINWLIFNCLLNPLCDSSAYKPRGVWEQALHATLYESIPSMLQSWFFVASMPNPSRFNSNDLPTDLYELFPLISRADLGDFDPRNPSGDIIKKAARLGENGCPLRLRYPLLCPPWAREMPDPNPSDNLFACYLAAGVYPVNLEASRVRYGALRDFFMRHPTLF
jgi:hypothetical protein